MRTDGSIFTTVLRSILVENSSFLYIPQKFGINFDQEPEVFQYNQ